MSEDLKDLKGRNITVGVKQTCKAVEKGKAKKVFIARDAEGRVTAGLQELCRSKGVEIVYVDTMKQLGKACGIEVGASAACILTEENQA